jgi:siroheme synthase-like protein
VRARYPALLELRGRRVLVVGGGEVALRKVRALLEAGSRPHVVAPALHSELEALAASGEVEAERRGYVPGEAAGWALVFAATDSAELNRRVAEDAGEGWVNVADDPELSTFHVPAALRSGEVTVALATGGASPLLARRLRERLESVVTPGLGRAAARLGELRGEVRGRWPSEEERRAFWQELVTHEFLDAAIAGRDAEVETHIARCLSKS